MLLTFKIVIPFIVITTTYTHKSLKNMGVICCLRLIQLPALEHSEQKTSVHILDSFPFILNYYFVPTIVYVWNIDFVELLNNCMMNCEYEYTFSFSNLRNPCNLDDIPNFWYECIYILPRNHFLIETVGCTRLHLRFENNVFVESTIEKTLCSIRRILNIKLFFEYYFICLLTRFSSFCKLSILMWLWKATGLSVHCVKIRISSTLNRLTYDREFSMFLIQKLNR